MSELSFAANPTSSAMLSDLLIAAEGASSTIESDSIIALLLFLAEERFGFGIELADELAFWISSAISLSKSSL